MAMVTVRYWAAAKQAAGIAEERLAADTLAGVISAVLARHGQNPDLAAVLGRSSFLVDGRRAGGNGTRSDDELAEGAIIEILPPFAGG